MVLVKNKGIGCATAFIHANRHFKKPIKNLISLEFSFPNALRALQWVLTTVNTA